MTDGVTQQALKNSAFAKTLVTCTADAKALEDGGKVEVSVAASVGNFQGQLQSRSYDVRVHTPHWPFQVQLTRAGGDTTVLPEMNSLSELDYSPART